ncbi:double homeobox protein A [Marmota flaviventris]|uniref:double homeobox protein A n=1 Tax=Marmota flaviventris TaxID=93162 RepID=UPI003A871B29
MAQDSSSNRPMPGSCRRDRTKFTKEQLKILIDTFNQMPYPNYATKQKLAVEVNTDESRIQVWFQNRRARHRFQERPELKEALESSQGPGRDGLPEQMRSEEARRCRTTYSPSQLHTLTRAFRNNPYPGIHCREQLAKEVGVPESRVQIWFQNRRSRLRVQKKEEPDETFEHGQGRDLSHGVQGLGGTSEHGTPGAQPCRNLPDLHHNGHVDAEQLPSPTEERCAGPV